MYCFPIVSPPFGDRVKTMLCRYLTQARRAGKARLEVWDTGYESRDTRYPASRIPYPLVARHSAISRRTFMNNAGYGADRWLVLEC